MGFYTTSLQNLIPLEKHNFSILNTNFDTFKLPFLIKVFIDTNQTRLK